MGRNGELYVQDFFAWAHTTATLIRQGKWHEVDAESVAEELESLGRSERHALESRIEVLIRHLLKWRYQPERRERGRSWRSTILEQRRRITRLLQSSPSLRPLLADTLQDEYLHARARALAETRLPDTTLPYECPWTVEQVLHDDFWPEA